MVATKATLMIESFSMGEIESLPVITSCEGCNGSCCREMNFIPFEYSYPEKDDCSKALLNDPELEKIPNDLQAEVRESFRRWQEDPQTRSDCPWLNEQGLCRHYDYRPKLCRQYEVGGDGCLDTRQHYGFD